MDEAGAISHRVRVHVGVGVLEIGSLLGNGCWGGITNWLSFICSPKMIESSSSNRIDMSSRRIKSILDVVSRVLCAKFVLSLKLMRLDV